MCAALIKLCPTPSHHLPSSSPARSNRPPPPRPPSTTHLPPAHHTPPSGGQTGEALCFAPPPLAAPSPRHPQSRGDGGLICQAPRQQNQNQKFADRLDRTRGLTDVRLSRRRFRAGSGSTVVDLWPELPFSFFSDPRLMLRLDPHPSRCGRGGREVQRYMRTCLLVPSALRLCFPSGREGFFSSPVAKRAGMRVRACGITGRLGAREGRVCKGVCVCAAGHGIDAGGRPGAGRGSEEGGAGVAKGRTTLGE